MKTFGKLVGTLVVAVVVAGGTLSQAADAPDSSEALEPVVGDINRFSFDLYKQLNTEGENGFFSPLSVSMAFGLATEGAAGKTAKQMRDALRYTQPQPQVAEGYQALMQSLNERQSDEDFKLHIANALWVLQGYPLKDAFLQTAQQDYLATVEGLEFKTQPDAAAQRINDWVSGKTNDKIKNLISPSAINDMTRLILTNAVYFKGTWQNKFQEAGTRPADFTTIGGDTVEVSMMRQMERFGYTETRGLQVLEMPYKRSGLAMTVLLPKENDGLSAVEEFLDGDRFQAVVNRLVYRRVDVSLPKFKLETKYSLNGPMQALGMNLAFQQGMADISKIADTDERLFIQSAVHKAYVNVDEKGTEAAAATGLIMQATVAEPEPPARFNADHPFLFVLRDTKTGAILFMGRVVSLSQTAAASGGDEPGGETREEAREDLKGGGSQIRSLKIPVPFGKGAR